MYMYIQQWMRKHTHCAQSQKTQWSSSVTWCHNTQWDMLKKQHVQYMYMYVHVAQLRERCACLQVFTLLSVKLLCISLTKWYNLTCRWEYSTLCKYMYMHVHVHEHAYSDWAIQLRTSHTHSLWDILSCSQLTPSFPPTAWIPNGEAPSAVFSYLVHFKRY